MPPPLRLAGHEAGAGNQRRSQATTTAHLAESGASRGQFPPHFHWSCEDEDTEEYERLLGVLWQRFQPVGELESLVVLEIAICFWKKSCDAPVGGTAPAATVYAHVGFRSVRG
jgi:hypothetical protein